MKLSLLKLPMHICYKIESCQFSTKKTETNISTFHFLHFNKFLKFSSAISKNTVRIKLNTVWWNLTWISEKCGLNQYSQNALANVFTMSMLLFPFTQKQISLSPSQHFQLDQHSLKSKTCLSEPAALGIFWVPSRGEVF